MDRRKWIKVVAVLMSVILLTGIVLNQTGLLKETTANADVWSGQFPPSDDKVKYGGGSGTSASPYNISSAEDLAQLVSNINDGYDTANFFQLAVDINLNNENWRAIGTVDNPFQGSFNANGHTIEGLNISTGTGSYYGLFGYIENATVKNVRLSGTIDVGAGRDVGAIAGRCVNSEITDCTFTGNVSGGSYVGGIVGTVTGAQSVVNGCSVTNGSMVVANSMAVGGIVGMLNANTKLFNSSNYAGVQLTAETSTGDTSSASGLVGYVNDAVVANCYNSGNVQSTFYANGLILGKTAVVQNCYNIGSVMAAADGRAGSISASLDASTRLNGVYFLQGTAEGYPGTLECFCTNVGTMTAANPDLEKYTNGSVAWNIVGLNLQEALDEGVSSLLSTYPGIIREWETDGSNNYYPVLTTTIGHEHDWNGTKETIESATCSKAGMEKVYCTKCDKSTTRVVDALGHNYKLSHKVVPTCTANGVDVEICSRCDDEQNPAVVPALGHRPKYTNVDPTCTEAGYEVTACAVCAYEFDRVDYAALGHNYDEKNFDVDYANCFSPELHYVHCTVCDHVRTDTVGVKREHTWDNPSGVAVEATCIEKGGMLRTCMHSDCGYSQWVIENEEFAEHKFEFKQTIAPTCEKKGYTLEECKVCKATREVDHKLPLSHNFVISKVTEPTCKTKGFTTYVCTNSNCGHTYDDKYVETLNHQWSETNNQAPSCMISGQIDYKCRLCEETKTDIVPAIGSHSFVTSEALSAEPTCTEDGEVVLVCQNDNTHTKVAEVIPRLGHLYEDTVVPPTCLLGGYTIHKCVRGDDETHINETQSLGHNMVTTVVPPTTTSMGYTEDACSRTNCNESAKRDYIAATPSAYFDYKTLSLVLSDMEEPMKYSLDKGVTWITTEAVSVSFTEAEMDALIYGVPTVTEAAMKVAEIDVSGTAVDVKTGAVIQVVRLGNRASEERPIADSYVQDLEILVAEQPSGMFTTIRPTVENGKGSITGVDETMEYRNVKDKTWTSVVGTTIENLTPGTYEVRVKATSQSLASDMIQLTIEEYVPIIVPSEEPKSSEEPGQSEVPKASQEPGQSEEPKVSAKPGESAKPNESSKPNETAKPGESKKPNATTVPGGNTGNQNNGGNNSTNNNSNNGNGSNGTGNGVSGTDNGGVIKNDIYYSSNGGSASNSDKISSAKTGDTMNMGGWIVVAGCALTALTVLALKKRKEIEE